MKNLATLLILLIVPALVLNCHTALAADGTWNVDADGDWSTSANWASGTVADGAGNTANFTYNITTNRTVTVNSARTIGEIDFGSSASATGIFWTLDSGTLTLDNNGSPPVIAVASTVFRGEISSSLAGTAGFNKTGNNTLKISGNNGISGNVTVSAGILSTYNSDSLKNADVIVSGGILDIGNGVDLTAKSLTVSGSGQIQARANNTIVNINVPMSIGKEGSIYTENNVQGVTLNVNSNVTLTANAGFELGGITNTLNINKPITGAYNLKLKGKSGGSTHNVHFNLNATNSYTGITYIEAWSCSATVDLNTHYCLPESTELHLDVNVGSGTNSLHLDMNSYTQQVTKLIMNAGSGTYIELMGNDDGIIIGKFSASGQLIYLTGGTIIANDEVSIGAPVIITNATLINNYRWASGTGHIDIYAGGKIGGAGKFDGAVTNYAGGTISAGEADSIATLYVNNKLIMKPGSLYDWKFGDTTIGEADRINCGALALPTTENSITVNVIKTSGPTDPNDTLVLFQTTGINGDIDSIFMDYSAIPDINKPVHPSLDGNNIVVSDFTPEPAMIFPLAMFILSFMRKIFRC